MKFRNTYPKAIGLIILVCTITTPLKIAAQSALAEATRRAQSLQTATTTSDSIKILLDVYNLSDKINRDRIRIQIINLTQRSTNQEVIGDALKELSISTDDAGQLNKLIEISESLPKNNTRENVQTLLMMKQAQKDAPNVTDSQIKNEIEESYMSPINIGRDPYKEIQNLYRAMSYLGVNSQGPLYLEYIQRLDELVNALPDSDHSIKNLFYTTAAIFYTRKHDYAKAIEYDRKMIDQLNKISKRFEEQGDDTHNLDYFYYVSYRRMLRNFMGLTPEEVEDIYAKCVKLAEENDAVKEEFGTGGLTKSYYFIATKQFAKAVPELKKALNDPTISTFRRQELLGLLAWALNETGDRNQELDVLREYTSMLLADMDQRRENTYREIELRNSVNKLISDQYVAQEKQRSQNKVMRETSITLVYVLAVILIFLCGAYFRLRHKVKELEIRNNKLHRNIEYIFDDGAPKGSTNLRNQKNRLKG